MSPLNFTHILTQAVDELSESESYKGLFHQHTDGIPLSHPGNGVLWVVTIHHRHIVAFEVIEVTRRQYGKGGFADPALLGGKGDIKGCFLVFHIAFVHYWLIDRFIYCFQSFFPYCNLEILKDCFISILFSSFHSFLEY